MKRKKLMLLATLSVALMAVSLVFAADATTTRRAASASSSASTLDTRVNTAVTSSTLPEFGTKPLGMIIFLR